jgi:hypothetical protein
MGRTDRVTTFPRALLALVGGAVVGAWVFVLEIAVLLALRPSKLGEINEYVGTTSAELFILIAAFSFIFFAAGLLIVGAPFWWVLHRFGRRTWLDAVVLGAALGAAGFVAMVMWNPEWPALSLISFLTEEFGGLTASNGRLSGQGWEALVRGAVGIAIAGALAGLALWRIAYRRPRPRSVQEPPALTI